ncbi:MAG: diadenylate cyclase CdaA [Clostridia bacterium]|nr:diadenylate cyclase CdaA [Clostridia bacterium]
MLEAIYNLWNFIVSTVMLIRLQDIIDILAVTFIFYQLAKFFKNTKSTQLLKGILIVMLLVGLSTVLGLNTLNFLLSSTLQFGVLALIILFQPEIRRILEQFGKKGVNILKFMSDDSKDSLYTEELIDNVTKAVFNLSANRTGALIAFEREIYLKEICDTGTYINSDCAQLLLENIFFHNSPLHDGGVVVSKGKVAAAGCLFPLSENKDISAELGTRHRAGLGLSEATDSVIIIVSEETGAISVAINGVLKRGFTREMLHEQLSQCLLPATEKKEKKFFKGRAKK